MKRFFIGLLAVFLCCGNASAATLFDFLLSQVRTSTTALVGGKVYFYAPGTTTLKTVWLDASERTVAANPYTLDANGTAQLYGSGLYRIVIKDSSGVTRYDRGNISVGNITVSTDNTFTGFNNFSGAGIKTSKIISNGSNTFTGFNNFSGEGVKTSDIVAKGPWVDVRSFCDGKSGRPNLAQCQVGTMATTEAAAVAQAALDSGLNVDFGPASFTWKISTPLNVRSHHHIRGAATIDASGIAAVSGYKINVFNVIDVEDVTIEGLTIDMGRSSYVSNGVLSGAAIMIAHLDVPDPDPGDNSDVDTAVKLKHFVLRDLTLKNVQAGIYALSDVEDVWIDHVKIDNHYAEGIGADIFYGYDPDPVNNTINGHYPYKVEIRGCNISSANASFAGVRLSGARNANVHDNVIENNTVGSQIYINDAGLSVENIDFHDNTVTVTNADTSLIEAGIKIFGASYVPSYYAASALWTAKNIKIHNNTITSGIDNTASKTNIRAAISANFVYGLSIIGNQIYNWQRAVDLEDVYDAINRPRTQATIIGNYVNKSALAPLYISNTTQVLVQGNRFKNWNVAATTATEKAGIDLRQQKRVRIIGNDFTSDDGNDALRTHLVFVTQGSYCDILDNTAPSGVYDLNVTTKDTTVQYRGRASGSNVIGLIRVLENGSANPYGTFHVGDKVRLFPAVNSGGTNYTEQVYTTAGTNKPATSATATGTNGESTITLSATTDFHVGDMIDIAGVTGDKTITDINWYTKVATLDSAIDADVSGAAITWKTLASKYGNALAP